MRILAGCDFDLSLTQVERKAESIFHIHRFGLGEGLSRYTSGRLRPIEKTGDGYLPDFQLFSYILLTSTKSYSIVLTLLVMSFFISLMSAVIYGGEFRAR